MQKVQTGLLLRVGHGKAACYGYLGLGSSELTNGGRKSRGKCSCKHLLGIARNEAAAGAGKHGKQERPTFTCKKADARKSRLRAEKPTLDAASATGRASRLHLIKSQDMLVLCPTSFRSPKARQPEGSIFFIPHLPSPPASFRRGERRLLLRSEASR